MHLVLLISKNDLEGGLALPNLVKFFRKGVRRIVPVAATVYFAYALSGLFKDVSIGTNIGLWFQTLEMPFWQVVIFFPLFTTPSRDVYSRLFPDCYLW